MSRLQRIEPQRAVEVRKHLFEAAEEVAAPQPCRAGIPHRSGWRPAAARDGQRVVEFIGEQVGIRTRPQRHLVFGIDRQRSSRQRLRDGHLACRVLAPLVEHLADMGAREPGQRVDRPPALPRAPASKCRARLCNSARVVKWRSSRRRASSGRSLAAARRLDGLLEHRQVDLDIERGGDALRDVAAPVPAGDVGVVEALGPQQRASIGARQLRGELTRSPSRRALPVSTWRTFSSRPTRRTSTSALLPSNADEGLAMTARRAGARGR